MSRGSISRDSLRFSWTEVQTAYKGIEAQTDLGANQAFTLYSSHRCFTKEGRVFPIIILSWKELYIKASGSSRMLVSCLPCTRLSPFQYSLPHSLSSPFHHRLPSTPRYRPRVDRRDHTSDLNPEANRARGGCSPSGCRRKRCYHPGKQRICYGVRAAQQPLVEGFPLEGFGYMGSGITRCTRMFSFQRLIVNFKRTAKDPACSHLSHAHADLT